MGRLEGKVAIITGAARGQGAAEARRLVQEGASVVLTDVLDEEGEAVAKSLGERAIYLHLDVRDEAAWTQVIETTMRRYGRIDVLVNNAAVLRLAPVTDLAPEQFRMVLEVNLVGAYLGMRAVIPKMRGGSSIINVASVNGLVGTPGLSAYAAAKHGLVGLTKSVAMEVGALGIRVNALCPGGVDTPMISDAAAATGVDAGARLTTKIPLGRLAKPEEMSGMIVFLASDDSSYCSGTTYVVDGGLTAGFSIA